MMQKETIKINRFPKMVYLQYQRALALNYPTWQAKAIGIAQAKKYAMFKNRRSYVPKGTEKENRQVTRKDVLYSLYKKEKNFNLYMDNDGYPIVANQKVTEQDFDKYMARFDHTTIGRLEVWSKILIQQASDDMLRTETKFFNRVWKPHRDDLI